MKGKLIIVIAFVFAIWGCANESRKNIVPKEFECLENYQTKVFVTYRQPVNGYKVKAMWFPGTAEIQDYPYHMHFYNRETVGKAILFFEKKDTSFYLPLDAYSDSLFFEDKKYKDYAFRDNEVFCVNYTEWSPFYFYDVDFDGEDELLIDTSRIKQRSATYKKCYDITEEGAILKTGAPFNDIDDFVLFDKKAKTINVRYGYNQTDMVFFCYKQKNIKTYGRRELGVLEELSFDTEYEIEQWDIEKVYLVCGDTGCEMEDTGNQVYKPTDKYVPLSDLNYFGEGGAAF